jgi:deazaflavin-dependent oxidoreductase (nitroreductase family)
LYRLGLGSILGRKILLLTTTGRKSGLPRTTPLQYELIGDIYFVGSMRGADADWYQNLVADPRVTLKVGRKTLRCSARAVADPEEVYAFLRYRLARNPRMIGAILRMDGLSTDPDENELREYTRGLTIVEIRPDDNVEQTPGEPLEDSDA